MYLDANDASFKSSSVNCDIAIIGAGPAGITLAEQFKNTPFQVCLLESGGFDANPTIQQLSDGPVHSPAPALEKNYLSLHSQRLFGGTGSVWGGYCRQLDDLDFEQRNLPFPHQWPISKQDLLPFYPWHALEGKHNQKKIPASTLETKYYERVIYPFHVLHKEDFAADKNIRVILNATVTGLSLQGSHSLAHINAVNSKQQAIQINAKVFVLACGGVGNVKLLLNANSVEKNGIGNQHDQVGRHFMEHPHFQFFDPPALLWLGDKQADWLFRDERYKPTFSLAAEQIREQKLLNFCAMISPPFEEGSKFAGSKGYRPNFSGLSKNTGAFYSLAFRCEQLPHPESHVTLADDRDALGLRRTQLHWQLAEADKNSLFRSIHLLAEELGKASLGRLQLLLDEKSPWQTMTGGGHLMGTTRMSERPEDGVVDRDCKIHDKDNLYVAGSSVFATSGVANPTLTVMALSRRLGAHLKEKLQS